MTNGMDINSSQANINIATAKSTGIQFVIVKMGGANVPIYVAPYYTAQIDRCISAGMPKGHYWVIGDASTRSPTSQADYFTSHLHGFDKTKDIVALDNEPLDDNNTFWGDAHTAEWINRVKANLGIDGTRVWVYGQRSLWTSGAYGPWPQTIATGCRFWVAYWGSNDGAYHAAPSLSGYIPAIHVQQYTDSFSVAGNKVDQNYSSYSIADLFTSTGGTGGGGGSTNGSGNMLSDSDRADLASYIDRAIGGKVDDIALSTWQHAMDSAIDGGSHIVQTYAAWAQRDLASVIAHINGDNPEFVLAKETSNPTVYALNIQKGTKHALTAGQLNVLLACHIDYKTVPDATLTAFTTT
jgi:hypothetical protein